MTASLGEIGERNLAAADIGVRWPGRPLRALLLFGLLPRGLAQRARAYRVGTGAPAHHPGLCGARDHLAPEEVEPGEQAKHQEGRGAEPADKDADEVISAGPAAAGVG